MKLTWKKLSPVDQDYELIIGLLFFPLLLLAAFFLSRFDGMLPVCRFRETSGFPCPTCGVFRATVGFLSGQWLSSLAEHPLAFVFLVAGSVYSLYSLVAVFSGCPRLRIVSPPAWLRPAVMVGLILSLLLNWFYLLAR